MLNAHTSRAIGAVIAVAALHLGGCSTGRTKVTEQWRDPTYAAGPMHSVVVLAQNAPASTRKDIEKEFVDELEDEHISAIPAYKILGDNPPDIDAARPILKSRGYDAMIVVIVERIDALTSARSQQNFYSAPFGSPSDMYNSPRLRTEYDVNVGTSLWDLRGNKTAWTSKTHVENVAYGDFGARISKKVVAEIAKQGLLAPSPR